MIEVDTPALVVDVDRLDRNLARWQAHCDAVGLANRPHVKTHKSVEIARRQVARWRHRPDPGPVDVARMLPVAYTVAVILIAMSVIILWADIVKPIRLG